MNSSGGAATAGGTSFQARLAAFYAARLLAEQPVGEVAGVPNLLMCEAPLPVDDVFVAVRDGGLYIQAKTTVSLSAADPEFLSAMGQFVRLFTAARESKPDALPWRRPLDVSRDRLMLIVSPACPSTIAIRFAQLLEKLRTAPVAKPLDQMAMSAGERDTWSTFVAAITPAWQAATGSSPSEPDARALAQLIAVRTLALDDGDSDSRSTVELLRALVTEAASASTAWLALTVVCLDLMRRRSSADLTALRRLLEVASVGLRPVPSAGPDIGRLRELTRTFLDALAPFARITIGEAVLHVSREIDPILRQAAAAGHLVVVGDPGAGKSGVLHAFVQSAVQAGDDVVLLAADQLSAASLPALQQELGLGKGIADVLRDWPGQREGYLVIDALDAARSDQSARPLRALIRAVVGLKSRWRVIVSIRKFDLGHTVELADLFAGSPVAAGRLQDAAFPTTRHLNIPPLSDTEFAALVGQAEPLARAVGRAPGDLQGLLRIPFYLFLLAQLVQVNDAAADVSATHTAVQLLDRYWSYRILRDERGGERELAIEQVCNAMLAAQALQVDRLNATRGIAQDTVYDLGSINLLVDRGNYLISFSHHLFFDYCVARLVFRGGAAAIRTKVSANHWLALATRPSILLALESVWERDPSRREFWQDAMALCTDAVPITARMVAGVVVASRAQSLNDLAPLLESVRVSDPSPAAASLLGFIVAAVYELEDNGRRGPWPAFAETISQSLGNRRLAYELMRILLGICEKPALLDARSGPPTARASANLLAYALQTAPRDTNLIRSAITCSARASQHAMDAVEPALRSVIDPDNVTAHGAAELFGLAAETDHLLHRPAFVRDLYVAAFTNSGESDEPTPLGSSRIMPLRSNRKQDYQVALWDLCQHFPRFLESFPIEATQALISAVLHYVRTDHRTTEEAVRFRFHGRDVETAPDWSQVWDAGNTYSQDPAVQILDRWSEFVSEAAAEEANTVDLGGMVGTVAAALSPAVIWRRLLIAGTERPTMLRLEVDDLLLSTAVLAMRDLSDAAGEYLKVRFGELPPEKREAIERAIFAITAGADPEALPGLTHMRDRLLGCLPRTLLVTAEARARLSDGEALPENHLREGPQVFSRSYGEEEYLQDRGVAIDAPANRNIRELEKPLRELVSRLLNKWPEDQDVSQAVIGLNLLLVALSTAEADGVHPELIAHAWTTACEAARSCAKHQELPRLSERGFIVDLLLKGSKSEVPVPDAKDSFENSMSAGPSPRASSTQGLMAVAFHPELARREILDRIRELSADPVPAVRHQVARALGNLARSAPDLMWELLERYVSTEATAGVLEGMVGGSLGRAAAVDAGKAMDLTLRVLDRSRGFPKPHLAQICVSLLADMFLWQRNDKAGAFVNGRLASGPASGDDVRIIISRVRELLTVDPDEVDADQLAAALPRAITVLNSVSDTAERQLRQSREGTAQLSESDATSLAGVIESVARDLYIGSGALDLKRGRGKKAPPSSVATRIYTDARPAMESIARSPVPSAVHSLLEMLEHLVPLDPPGVFVLTATAVTEGRRAGLQFESLAVDVAVRIVERYLADYRDLLANDERCRAAVIAVLDVFVEVGWPAARRLAYRLDDAFR